MSTTIKPISREYRIYLALWRKAYLTGETVSLVASSFQMALVMRRGLYRAIRPFRNGEQFDEELRLAAEALVVAVPRGDDPKSPHVIVIKPRLSLSELEAELSRLGLDEEDLQLTEERKLGQDLSNLLDEPKPAKNPFYDREG